MIKELETKFGKYIENINFYKEGKPIDSDLKKEFLKLFHLEKLQDREELWGNFKVNINSVSQIPLFANPYFLGFGNPKSDLLFIGKEKAFDIYKSPKSFLYESFNNTLQWKLIEENKTHKFDSFDPREPRKYHKKKIKSIHTWGKYAQIISKLVELKKTTEQEKLAEFLSEYRSENDSFFEHCFMTEINHVPSRYSIGHNLIEERKSLLKFPFYKSFKTVVIGAKGYLKNSEIIEIFDVNLIKEKKVIGTKGKLGNKKIEINLFESDKQQIIYCQQLSGASGWTNKAIDKLAEIIKENHR